MKKVLILLAVVLLAWFGFKFFGPVSYKNFPPTASGDWIAYGDSLTSGYGASEGNDYPTLLGKKLGIPIRNFGVAGDTTADGLARLNDAIQIKPRVVLLCLGGNDGLQRRSPEEMISNLQAIIKGFQQAGSFVVLIGVRSASVFDSNESKFKKLARQEGALYVPNILDDVLGSPSKMSDQVHPNEVGYEQIAERMAGILRPLLPKLK